MNKMTENEKIAATMAEQLLSQDAPSLTNRVPLQQWYGRWLTKHRDTNLIYAKPNDPQLHQVHFVRDTLAPMLWQGIKYADVPDVIYYDSNYYDGDMRSVKDVARVIGEHSSKSVKLPVYQLVQPDLGIELVLRYNFHDWNVSVLSERPITFDVSSYGSKVDDEYRKRYPNGYTRGGYWGGLYFQGFPIERMFGPQEENSRQFSLYPYDDYELYAFVRELVGFLRKPR